LRWRSRHWQAWIQDLAARGVQAKRRRILRDLRLYREDAGVFRGKSRVRIAQALVNSEAYDLDGDIQHMREIREDTRLVPQPGVL
jgi:hypothetical protein